MNVEYAETAVEQIVKMWRPAPLFDAEEQIEMHISELFDLESVCVLKATDCHTFLMLTLTSAAWPSPREFGLLDTGSLVWK